MIEEKFELTPYNESTTKRITIPTAEEILYKVFPVLDCGFVRLVDYMGGDESIVQAARVSYGKGTKKVSEDRGLIRYLMRHRHTTPFEMVELKFHIRTPMDVWRQWIRHRTASVNEYSTRYSIAIDATHTTSPNEWRLQSSSNKQGSEDFLDEKRGRKLSKKEKEFHKLARELYEKRLNIGVAREQARKDLPLSTYTEAYWKIDLHNLFHFLGLRMDKTAQYEIRQYANEISKITKAVVPIAYEAFNDYILEGIRLSNLEKRAIAEIMDGKDKEKVIEEIFGRTKKGNFRREGREFLEKLEDIKNSL